MARPRKASSREHFSPGQAKYILERIIGDRRISAADIRRYQNEMRREIGELEQRLQSLREAATDAIRGAIDKLTPGRRRGRPPGTDAKRRSAKITPEQLASRQLQGRYLGLIRQIPASRRATYKKIATEKGREAAIKEMMTALKK